MPNANCSANSLRKHHKSGFRFTGLSALLALGSVLIMQMYYIFGNHFLLLAEVAHSHIHTRFRALRQLCFHQLAGRTHASSGHWPLA